MSNVKRTRQGKVIEIVLPHECLCVICGIELRADAWTNFCGYAVCSPPACTQFHWAPLILLEASARRLTRHFTTSHGILFYRPGPFPPHEITDYHTRAMYGLFAGYDDTFT